MGCCASTTTTNTTPLQKAPHISETQTGGDDSRSPPPTYSPPEQETVKQALSHETKSASLSHDFAITTDEKKRQHQNGTVQAFRRRFPARFNNLSFTGEPPTECAVGKYPDPYRCRPGKGGAMLAGSESMSSDPGRLEFGSGEWIRKVDEGKTGAPTYNELIENSLVSLECFIFL